MNEYPNKYLYKKIGEYSNIFVTIWIGVSNRVSSTDFIRFYDITLTLLFAPSLKCSGCSFLVCACKLLTFDKCFPQ